MRYDASLKMIKFLIAAELTVYVLNILSLWGSGINLPVSDFRLVPHQFVADRAGRMKSIKSIPGPMGYLAWQCLTGGNNINTS